ncbi:MAG: hypothetical protein IJ189_05520 [Clostridia bacterium]|nr:hypothetical protein [Clostridia bacterium]
MVEKRAAGLALLLALALLLGGCGASASPAPTEAPIGTEAPPAVAEPVVSVSAGGLAVAAQEGEIYFPSEEQWSYHFVYSYPHLLGEDYVSAAINDTYQMALDEMLQLVLPMFANADTMQFDGQNEVSHDFYVTCNNDRLLSIVQNRRQTMGEEGVTLAIEPLTFDVSGEYQGDTLTLRGCILADVGDTPVDEMTVEAYPQAAKLIAGSSESISEAVAQHLYPEFVKLQEAGIARGDVDEEDFLWEFAPAANFYVDEEGRVVFFFPPALLAEPSFDVPTFPFTAAELENLL